MSLKEGLVTGSSSLCHPTVIILLLSKTRLSTVCLPWPACREFGAVIGRTIVSLYCLDGDDRELLRRPAAKARTPPRPPGDPWMLLPPPAVRQGLAVEGRTRFLRCISCICLRREGKTEKVQWWVIVPREFSLCFMRLMMPRRALFCMHALTFSIVTQAGKRT